jgi:tRNA-specific adenosine deaminase 2
VLDVARVGMGSGLAGLEAVQVGGEEGKRAVLLLRRFYLRENERAPQPRKKINRVLRDPGD